VKWIRAFGSWITLTLLIYAAGRFLYEDNMAFWAPVSSVIVVLTYMGLPEKYRSKLTRLSSLISLLGLFALSSTILFAGDCALGLMRAPAHSLWTECINDSEPGFSITAGTAALSLGVAIYGYLQLIFASLIDHVTGIGTSAPNKQ